jgi:poly(3-hydroxybutyrate) depolymerase
LFVGNFADRRAVIHCGGHLLAGDADDITTPEQVLNAANLGTSKDKIIQRTVPGARTLKDQWAPIAPWICAQ